ncbi:hypothetical protein [Pseudomonas mosselii]|uniref:hypothetical protein n=1 Tax=Pseudomonas mosselii TaxID=78327 RepID=UPI0021DB02F4|nr:hypothetical protein [Pseudomonas mosselii]MCU9528792.1 hypothetical protein [Pseudomonas mosselii]MCU9536127.1 hypothetical protein [Pseudomonas mosselii]MCU9541762.1 hypothetical protein [Pseudomonas mosselii]MCU9547721.1 hypothetical protein [Pseudomonas mosselii]
MKLLALCLLLLATGANAATPDAEIRRLEREDMSFGAGVTVIHDDRRNVTCWALFHYYGAGISCIPDNQLQAGNERQLSPHETQPEPTPAAAPAAWNDERYQL